VSIFPVLSLVCFPYLTTHAEQSCGVQGEGEPTSRDGSHNVTSVFRWTLVQITVPIPVTSAIGIEGCQRLQAPALEHLYQDIRLCEERG